MLSTIVVYFPICAQKQNILEEVIIFAKRALCLTSSLGECVGAQQIDFIVVTASIELSSSSIRDGSRIKKADLMGKGITKAGEKGVEQG